MKKEIIKGIISEEDKFDIAFDTDKDFRREYEDSQQSLLTLCDAVNRILGVECCSFETYYKIATALREDKWLDTSLNPTDKAKMSGYFRVIETYIEYPADLQFVGEPAFYQEKQTYLTNSGVKWLKNFIRENINIKWTLKFSEMSK